MEIAGSTLLAPFLEPPLQLKEKMKLEFKYQFASIPIERKYAAKFTIEEALSEITIHQIGRYVLVTDLWPVVVTELERTDAFPIAWL